MGAAGWVLHRGRCLIHHPTCRLASHQRRRRVQHGRGGSAVSGGRRKLDAVDCGGASGHEAADLEQEEVGDVDEVEGAESGRAGLVWGGEGGGGRRSARTVDGCCAGRGLRFGYTQTLVCVCVDIVLRLCAAQKEIPSGEDF